MASIEFQSIQETIDYFDYACVTKMHKDIYYSSLAKHGRKTETQIQRWKLQNSFDFQKYFYAFLIKKWKMFLFFF